MHELIDGGSSKSLAAVHPRRCRRSPSKLPLHYLVGLLAALVMISNVNIIRIHHGYLAKYNNSIYASIYGVQQQTATHSIHNNCGPQIVEPTQCTSEDLAIIKKQLPPEDCHTFAGQPWTQRCSLTYATRCPDNSGWLGKYYTKLHSTAGQSPDSKTNSPFLGIFIGCNKGLDAIDAFRMGTGDPTFDKSRWKNAITRSGKIQLDTDVCNQASVPQFELPKTNRTQQQTRGSTKAKQSASAAAAVTLSQLHCIEPMPLTVLNLQRTAYETGYAKKGFIVTHAAMSRHDGFVPFAKFTGAKTRTEVGIENKGIGNAMDPSECRRGLCMNVSMYSLDTYMDKFVTKHATTTSNDNDIMPINYLSIDVEGYDYEVLMGGANKTLPRVHYLEFEYNWVGAWASTKLSQAIQHLDTEFGFTCYWAGFNDTIWRITNCWLDHYDVKFWSNVACVNRNAIEVREVAHGMERLFNETLRRGVDVVRDYEHRFKRKKGDK